MPPRFLKSFSACPLIKALLMLHICCDTPFGLRGFTRSSVMENSNADPIAARLEFT